MAAAAETPVIPLEECRRFIMDCMQAVGTPCDNARALADVLVEADYRGHFSYGMSKLELYINDVRNSMCDGSATAKILNETVATAWVDGCNGLGPVVGRWCMKLAMEKAKCVGVGLVCVKGGNYYGIASTYSMQALSKGMLGFSCTNTSPLMTPTRAKKAALGTNPLSLAAPALEEDNFVLDMGTTTITSEKIEMHVWSHKLLPEGWAMDKNGKVVTDPKEALEAKCLTPLGGAELTSGYKGYGLGILVEILCGILAGSKYGPKIPNWGERTADLGQCFIAIDPKCFALGFEHRLSNLLTYLRHMDPADPGKPVLVPGDPERQHMEHVDRAGGIRYDKHQMQTCQRLAEALNVQPLEHLA